jgi:hypothetical protein
MSMEAQVVDLVSFQALCYVMHDCAVQPLWPRHCKLDSQAACLAPGIILTAPKGIYI